MGTNERKEYSDLVNEYTPKVFDHAYRILGNREDAEEATYDVFLRVYYGLQHFRGDASISTWIWRITFNVCLSRKRKKEFATQSLDEQTSSIPETAADCNPHEQLHQLERREILASFIAQLPEREAAAISLFYLEEMDYDEIAKILQIPAGSVATALHRGRERLRKLLAEAKVQL